MKRARREELIGRPVLLAVLVLAGACTEDFVVPRAPEAAATPPGVSRDEASTGAGAVSTPTVLVGAGDVAACNSSGDEATAALLDAIPGTVFTAGDNAYPKGASKDFTNCFQPTWGRHKARIRPAPGDTDYQTANAAAYYSYFGSAAGEPGRGYYSYDLGDWHVVVLNSATAHGAGSTQEQWLRADLAASTKRCTVAYWHHPLFSSSSAGGLTSIRTIWDALYAAGVEIVVNANFWHYERFAPQTPAGAADPAHGIRQFVVGTGGNKVNTSFSTPRPNSEVRRTGTFGVLRLTLDADTYAWQFVPVAGQSFSDSGTGTCHDPAPPPQNQPPVANPGGPYSAPVGSALQFDGTGSSDPDGDLPLTYAWSFGDGSSGTGATPQHTYAAAGSYTVSLTVTDSRGLAGTAATTTATISAANQPPVAVPGGPYSGTTGVAVQFDGSGSSDPDGDLPLTYAWSFGDGSSGTGATPQHTYAAAGSYTVSLTVTDSRGLAGTAATTTATISAAPGQTAVLVGAGDIGRCDDLSKNSENTAKLLDQIPGAVMGVGDFVEPDAVPGSFDNCYHRTWGRHKDRTWPALGNSDRIAETGFAEYFAYWGEKAGDPSRGYYAFDLGEWRIIVLNSNFKYFPTARGSAQEQWLRAELAANPRLCTLAFFHHPLYFSHGTSTVQPEIRPLWEALYDFGAEIVVTGHRHFYERFAPQTPLGVADPERGIRQFIVGRGGGGTSSITGLIRPPNSEVLDASAYGVLKLTLAPTGYTWEFVPVAGKTFRDTGSGICH